MTMKRVAMTFGSLAACLIGLSAKSAHADDETPKGVLSTDAASKGNTDVATSGFETSAKRDAEAAKNATDLKISAGGLGAAGNSRSLALTAAETFRMRRDSEQLSIASAANYAQAGKVGTPTTASVENVQGKLRYDHFFVGSFAGFLGVSARHDRFQGLDLRLNLDPGIAYYFVDEKKEQLWGELGYDFQYDIRRQSFLDTAAAAGAPVSKTQGQSGGRAFVGYLNKVNDHVTFATDLEYVQSVQNFDRFRINWDASVSSAVGGSFSLATTMLVQYDNTPLLGVLNTDTTVSISLVYKLL